MKSSRNTLKAILPLMGALALAPATHAFDLGSLFGGKDADTEKAASSAADAVSGAQSAATTGSAMADGLVGMLSEQLGISKNQAIGGLGALVGYAGSSLPPEYADQLNQMFPAFSKSSGGVDSTGGLMGSLMNNVSSMDSVKTAFSGLGMDPSMVNQFTPLIESYVGDNGGSSDLVGALGKLW
ncbi:DUF2780 domain-containing protein [Pseudomaricurvus sp.]|uniref:DUF2780 domain-containing protein n=1 Tax=Pseudomaricurvus sp. TaxID=2004510 RepID=UPI003F6C26DE